MSWDAVCGRRIVTPPVAGDDRLRLGHRYDDDRLVNHRRFHLAGHFSAGEGRLRVVAAEISISEWLSGKPETIPLAQLTAPKRYLAANHSSPTERSPGVVVVHLNPDRPRFASDRPIGQRFVRKPAESRKNAQPGRCSSAAMETFATPVAPPTAVHPLERPVAASRCPDPRSTAARRDPRKGARGRSPRA